MRGMSRSHGCLHHIIDRPIERTLTVQLDLRDLLPDLVHVRRMTAKNNPTERTIFNTW